MLTPPLSDVEVRVLGSLVEKEVTTPDNYPLSLSALLSACNQLSNRDPVMLLDEDAITPAVVALRRRGLLRVIQPVGSRVTKYQHLLGEEWSLDARELAVLGVLMLRGEQTPGELHARTARLAEFEDLARVESTLDGLVTRAPEPLVLRLPRRAGQKEVRYAHLLGGEVATPGAPAATSGSPPREQGDTKTLEALARDVEELRAELAAFRAQFEAFRAQFQ